MLRILLVEDEPDIALVASAVLEDAGHHVTVAFSGKQGLAIALQEHPELIITDFMMPGMNGLEMVDQLRAAGIETPVILATAIEQSHLPTGPRQYSAYLLKPYGMRELLGAVAALSL